jgi:hypothetical protein
VKKAGNCLSGGRKYWKIAVAVVMMLMLMLMMERFDGTLAPLIYLISCLLSQGLRTEHMKTYAAS